MFANRISCRRRRAIVDVSISAKETGKKKALQNRTENGKKNEKAEEKKR